MYCLICKKPLKQKIHFGNLFKIDTHHLCERCFKKTEYQINIEVIPIKNALLYKYTLFELYQNPNAVSSFLKPFYQAVIKYNIGIIVVVDLYDEKDYLLLDCLDFGDILLISLFNKINIKENKYEN